MPYVADIAAVRKEELDNRAAPNHYGESEECVALVKYFAKAPQTTLWKKGDLVKGNKDIIAGTAIATFDDQGNYKGHAAIYDGQDANGITVYDQWQGQGLHTRIIRFRGGRRLCGKRWRSVLCH